MKTETEKDKVEKSLSEKQDMAINGDDVELSPDEADLIVIDPPYIPQDDEYIADEISD